MNSNNNNVNEKKRIETPVWFCPRGSYTVEAAIIMPLVMSFVVGCIFVIQFCVLKAGVQRALDRTSTELACVSNDSEEEINVFMAGLLCDGYIMTEDIPKHYIVGDVAGINYLGSKLDGNYIHLKVSYFVRFPLQIFGLKLLPVIQTSDARKWVGYDPNEGLDSAQYVYVTEYGEVYHLNRNCTYLNPSVKAVSIADIKSLRNSDGSKYMPCNHCHSRSRAGNTVFITDYGEVYHASLGCSGLKRTIYRKTLEEVQGMACCSKCGG